MAEAIGPSNNTQVIDLAANNNNIFSPAYAIYDSGNLMRVLLFNYVTDSSGASNLSIDLTLSGGQNPSQAQVKCVCAPFSCPTILASRAKGYHFLDISKPRA
jgi:hypothetical protein